MLPNNDHPAPLPAPASPVSAYPADRPPMAPERAAYLRSQVQGIALLLLDSMAHPDPEEEARLTATERMMGKVLRSQIPRLRSALLSRLSSTDPRRIEAIIGATETALLATLYYAPGEPEPRYRFEWYSDENGPTIGLVPDER